MNQTDGCPTSFHPWYFDLKPSTVTFLNLKTGARIVEPSYVAVETKQPPSPAAPKAVRPLRPLAVGKAALAYQNTPDVAVYSPLRQGQIADYGMTEYFFKTFLKQLLSKPALFKPVLCIHEQEVTTEVEERALIDAGIQAGARRVFLYTQPLSTCLSYINNHPENKSLKNAIIIHIDPQD